MARKILIVDGFKVPLETIKNAVDNIFPNYFPDFNKGNYDVARSYRDARDSIIENVYQFIILGHRLPMNDPRDSESSYPESFIASLQNIGYSLIQGIRERNLPTVVIGTGPFSWDDVGVFPEPDFRMNAERGKAERSLDGILKKLLEAKK